MIGALDTGLEFFRQVLALRGYRQEILSADLANASTPGFKAVDLDFAAALKSAAGGAQAALWLVDDPRQMRPGGAGAASAAAAPAVKYVAGTEVTMDGNSVDLDRTKMDSAKNAVEYEAATTFASQTLRMLQTAINGSGPASSGS